MGLSQSGMFRSLRNPNYRLWVGGSFISNIGSWMQGTAQNWLVLTELTHHKASAVGLVTALQFAPQLLLVAFTGTLADHSDRRKLLIVVQSAMALCALLLGIVTVTGVVRLWHVYIFAVLLGTGMAFEAPARHSFVPELVGNDDLGNAVALNSTCFNLARMVGPAAAGLLITVAGTGWLFVINAASFLVVIAGLVAVKVVDLHREHPEGVSRAGLLDGFRYVRHRPDIMTIFMMLFLLGALGMNFSVYIVAMSVTVFHKGASEFGFLSSVMAIGSVSGALLAARRDRPRLSFIIGGATLFGCAMLLAAIAPSFLLFGALLIVLGLAVQTMTTSASAFVQLSTDRAMRGRVMAIHVAILLGGLPLGAPLVGWVADRFGARWAIAAGGAAGFAAALVGLGYLIRQRGLRIVWREGGPALSIDPDPFQQR